MDLFTVNDRYDLIEPFDEHGNIDEIAYAQMLNQVADSPYVVDVWRNPMEVNIPIIYSEHEYSCIEIAKLIKNLEIEHEMIEHAIEEMENRQSKLTRKKRFLTNYLQQNLESLGIKEITLCPYFVIRICKNPPAIDINDPALVPKEYFITKEPVVVPNKKLMKEEIEQGVIIPGVKLVQNTRLEIK